MLSTIIFTLLPLTALASPFAGKRFANSTTPAPTPSNGTSHNTPTCTPGKYQCHYDSAKSIWGWDTCSTAGLWVPSGSCAASETCTYNPLSMSPYCVPTPVTPTPKDDECNPDTYLCAYDAQTGWYINTCANGHWKREVDCKKTETCTYSPVRGYPYCKPKEDARVCVPATYQCKYDSSKNLWGWEVCNTEGQWVSGGYCKSSETCSFNPLNGSPYCL